MAVPTLQGWQNAILGGVGAPVTPENVQLMNAWAQAEGGGASNNPFNTTEPAQGATSYNSVGVQNYQTPQQGIAATIATLQNGRYGNVLSALQAGNNPMAVAQAIAASPWGTGQGVVNVLKGGGISSAVPQAQVSARSMTGVGAPPGPHAPPSGMGMPPAPQLPSSTSLPLAGLNPITQAVLGSAMPGGQIGTVSTMLGLNPGGVGGSIVNSLLSGALTAPDPNSTPAQQAKAKPTTNVTMPDTGTTVQLQGKPQARDAAAVQLAERFVNKTPYQWGGTSPSGFDCSGLLQYVWKAQGVDIPRTTYDQFQSGTPVAKSNLQPGDAVFFTGSDPKGDLPGHVGMYIGGGKFIEAPHTGADVRISTLAGRSDYVGARSYN